MRENIVLVCHTFAVTTPHHFALSLFACCESVCAASLQEVVTGLESIQNETGPFLTARIAWDRANGVAETPTSGGGKKGRKKQARRLESAGGADDDECDDAEDEDEEDEPDADGDVDLDDGSARQATKIPPPPKKKK